MTAHWAMQRWTFGAGHVALRPEPYRGADPDLTLWHGLALASQEWSRAGSSRRTLGTTAVTLLLGAWLVAALIADALRDRDTTSGLEIVMLETPPLPEPVVIPEPEPIVEPEPVIEAAKPEPIVKPERVAARPPAPPPAPEPVPIAKPAPPRAPIAKPTPAPVTIARPVFPAAPAPLVRAPRSAAPQPRVQVARPSLPKPVISIDAVAAPAAPAEASPPTSEPPRLALRPVAAPAARPRPAPSFDLGAPAAPSRLTEPAAPAASTRALLAVAPSTRATARGVARPPPSLALPALAVGGPVRDPGAEPTPFRVAARDPAPTGGAARSRSDEPKLRGVALASLASCVSDRDEDALKQQLVALLGEPAECVSTAGRYRFVETRNLNAFLLWVERAPARPAADRCVELTHALDCVRKHAGREWHRG